MYGSRIDLDEITLLNRNAADKLIPPAFGNHFRKLFLCLRIMPNHKLCTLRAVQNVPAFGLS